MTQWFTNIIQQIMDFSNILNASIAASWMVLAVIVLRFFLKKAPRWTQVALWGLVALRLLLPFSIESPFSLIPSKETVPREILVSEGEALQGSASLDIVSNPVFPDSVTVDTGETMDRVQISMVKMTPLWIAGMAALLVYTAVSYWLLRRKVSVAVILRDTIYQSEVVGSPFVLGIVKPKIYLPFKLDNQSLGHVVAHEQAHIRRKDHWWKMLGFLLLTIHWFNPLMWLAYVLLCRDIELACDEKVIKDLSSEQRAEYTQSLVACSVSRRRIAACPLAFGEVGVKERVRSVMNYKKPTFWGIVLAVTACAAVAVCFLTDPKSDMVDIEWNGERYVVNDKDFQAYLSHVCSGEDTAAASPVTKWFDYLESPAEMNWDGCLEIELPEFPNVTFRWYPEKMEAVNGDQITPLYTGMPIWNAYFCDLNGDGPPELCSTLSYGSGMIDSRVIVYDYANGTSYELSDRGRCDYTLRQNAADGSLWVEERTYNSGDLVTSGRLILAGDRCSIENGKQ